VGTVPVPAMFAKPGSVAISQVTSTVGPWPEPGVESGVGVTRVQSSTPSGNGSPDATPCAKAGSPSAAQTVVAVATAPPTATVAAATPDAFRTERRSNTCDMVTKSVAITGGQKQPFCVNIGYTVASYRQ
jgi:hypothetical protein